MPFYIRKSVSAGPFRFNFSKGGVGVSVGVKGLRLGTGPRGHYIHAGAGGLYYRKSLGRAGERRATTEASPRGSDTGFEHTRPIQPARVDNVEMIEIESGDVMGMQDETFSSLLAEINEKQRQGRMSSRLGWTFGILGTILGILIGGASGVGLAGALAGLIFIPAAIFGRWLDSYRRVSVLYYDLEPDAEASYRALAMAFERMMASGGKWHVAAGGHVGDLTTWKRNAGATMLVDKKPTVLAYATPSVITTNVSIPSIHVGRQILYLLPDVVLIRDGDRYGAVGYGDLKLQFAESNFIEEGTVPHDAIIVSHTWKHPNKKGGPDRRYKSNRQIPVCRYEALRFNSGSGLNELVEFSRLGVSEPFCQAAFELGKTLLTPVRKKPRAIKA